MKRAIAFAIAVFSAVGSFAQTSIPVSKDTDGRYRVEATLNGVAVKTFYTEESWFASVSSTTYLFLYENGYIADADVRGMTTVTMPGGKSTKAGSFVIRNLRMGNVIVKDLPAFVIAKQNVPLLIGSSTFDCFGEVSIEGDRLIVNDADEVAVKNDAAVLTPAEALKQEAQEHIDAKEYRAAAESFEALARIEPLSMYHSYQYIVVLNILQRSDETISLSSKWLKDNGGKSLPLDYWIYDCLGDAYARKKQTSNAIVYYEAAVSTYYRMFNTDEKEVRRSAAKDETLGVTLFDLGRQYAAAGNHKKAVNCMSLAAKSGNAGAKEFCDKYKVKY